MAEGREEQDAGMEGCMCEANVQPADVEMKERKKIYQTQQSGGSLRMWVGCRFVLVGALEDRPWTHPARKRTEILEIDSVKFTNHNTSHLKALYNQSRSRPNSL